MMLLPEIKDDRIASCVNSELQIRWLVRRDLDEVLAIEAAQFPQPWTESDFMLQLRQQNCIATVAEQKSRIIGYCVYELHKDYLSITNMAVHPDYVRLRIGSAMVQRLVNRLSHRRRNRLISRVSESNLDAQQFFSFCGFRCVGIDRGYYFDVDAYTFRYQLPHLPIQSDRFTR